MLRGLLLVLSALVFLPVALLAQPYPQNICAFASPSCSSVANIARFWYQVYLLNKTAGFPYNGLLQMSITNFGPSGLAGMSSLLARQSTGSSNCTLVLGPGDSVALDALTPIINAYTIPQLDSTISAVEISTGHRYPMFSRTIPSESFSIQTMAEICNKFSWERVIVITNSDSMAINSLSNALMMAAVLLEDTYYVDDISTDAAMTAALVKLQTIAVARIVIPLLPSNYAPVFSRVFQALGMTSTHIVLMSNAFCAYNMLNPSFRVPFVSSFCVGPIANPARLAAYDTGYFDPLMQATVTNVLIQGGFGSLFAPDPITGLPQCSLNTSNIFTAFALDAFELFNNTLRQPGALQSAGSPTNVTGITALFRSFQVTTGPTQPFSLNPLTGDRDYAIFGMDIMTPGGVVVPIGQWDSNVVPASTWYQLATPIVWLDNTTNIPPATFRSISFIATQTIQQHPGSIALSVLGFAATGVVFWWCYRHYKIQRLVEESLTIDNGSSAKMTTPA